MAKISYTKVENSIGASIQQILIDRLSELATLVTLIYEPQSKVPPKKVEELVNKFQLELKSLKEKDVKLFARLELSPEEEAKFLGNLNTLTSDEWARLKTLKERIDELKRELFGMDAPKPEYEEQVQKERQKHLNKRYNIRDGWLPLH